MAKIRIFLFIVFLSHNYYVVGTTEVNLRECLAYHMANEVGVREATGKNDGKRVEQYLKSVGLGKGYSWCSAFVKFIFDCCNFKTPINAWSPTSHNPRNIVYFQGKFIREPRVADVFTIYSATKKRISHTGFFYKPRTETTFYSIEGNTNDGGSFDGDGVYKRIRNYKYTYSITSWIYD